VLAGWGATACSWGATPSSYGATACLLNTVGRGVGYSTQEAGTARGRLGLLGDCSLLLLAGVLLARMAGSLEVLEGVLLHGAWVLTSYC